MIVQTCNDRRPYAWTVLQRLRMQRNETLTFYCPLLYVLYRLVQSEMCTAVDASHKHMLHVCSTPKYIWPVVTTTSSVQLVYCASRQPQKVITCESSYSCACANRYSRTNSVQSFCEGPRNAIYVSVSNQRNFR